MANHGDTMSVIGAAMVPGLSSSSSDESTAGSENCLMVHDDCEVGYQRGFGTMVPHTSDREQKKKATTALKLKRKLPLPKKGSGQSLGKYWAEERQTIIGSERLGILKTHIRSLVLVGALTTVLGFIAGLLVNWWRTAPSTSKSLESQGSGSVGSTWTTSAGSSSEDFTISTSSPSTSQPLEFEGSASIESTWTTTARTSSNDFKIISTSPTPFPTTLSTTSFTSLRTTLCASCEAEGKYFKAVSNTDNEDMGILGIINVSHRTVMPKKGVYAVDKYDLQDESGLPMPFFWAMPSHYTFEGFRAEEARKNYWTRANMARWASLIEPGSNVVDIGANVGDTTVEMAVYASKTIAFEAHPQTAKIAQAQASVNPQFDIIVHPFAVGDRTGTLDLNVDCDGCNSGPVQTRAWVGKVIQVRVVQLNTFLLDTYGESFFKEVSFIKIDTEGYDRFLLRNMKPLLRLHRPKFWVEWFRPYWTSCEPNHVSKGSADLFAAVREIGYLPLHPQTHIILSPECKNGIPDLLLVPM